MLKKDMMQENFVGDCEKEKVYLNYLLEENKENLV